MSAMLSLLAFVQTSPPATATFTATEVSQLVSALRAFPGDLSVVRPACDAIRHSLANWAAPGREQLLNTLMDGGLPTALIACVSQTDEQDICVWAAAHDIVTISTNGQVATFCKAGWTASVLRALKYFSTPSLASTPPALGHLGAGTSVMLSEQHSALVLSYAARVLGRYLESDPSVVNELSNEETIKARCCQQQR